MDFAHLVCLQVYQERRAIWKRWLALGCQWCWPYRACWSCLLRSQLPLYDRAPVGMHFDRLCAVAAVGWCLLPAFLSPLPLWLLLWLLFFLNVVNLRWRPWHGVCCSLLCFLFRLLLSLLFLSLGWGHEWQFQRTAAATGHGQGASAGAGGVCTGLTMAPLYFPRLMHAGSNNCCVCLFLLAAFACMQQNS